MFIRYSKWTEQSMTDEQRLQQLLSLFSYLLLKTSGDVREALEWMRTIGEENELFDDKFTFEDFVQKLKELGYIDEAKDMLILTTKGVQRIRQDALNEIFTNLKRVRFLVFTRRPTLGEGIDRLSETRPYQFGDQPTNIDLTSTVTNALIRMGLMTSR
jgi:Ca-activated chloride channel family protein